VPTAEGLLAAHPEHALVEPLEQALVARLLDVPEHLRCGEGDVPLTPSITCLGGRQRPGDTDADDDDTDDTPERRDGILGRKATGAGRSGPTIDPQARR